MEQLITPSFDQVADRVGPGVYKTRIMDAKSDKWEGKDGKPDTRYVNWRMETFDESETKNNGRSIWHRTPIEGQGAFRLQEFYRAATGEDCTGAFDPTSLYGREIEVTVVQQQKNPQYTEIKSVRSLK